MPSNTFGYIRVSSQDQNEDRQLIAMREKLIPKSNLFIDKQSGKDFERPQYRRMLRKLRGGDPSLMTLANWQRFCFGMLDLAKRQGWK